MTAARTYGSAEDTALAYQWHPEKSIESRDRQFEVRGSVDKVTWTIGDYDHAHRLSLFSQCKPYESLAEGPE